MTPHQHAITFTLLGHDYSTYPFLFYVLIESMATLPGSWVRNSIYDSDRFSFRPTTWFSSTSRQIKENCVIYLLTLVEMQLLIVRPAHSNKLWIRSINWEFFDAVLNLRLINVQFTLWNFLKSLLLSRMRFERF